MSPDFRCIFLCCFGKADPTALAARPADFDPNATNDDDGKVRAPAVDRAESFQIVLSEEPKRRRAGDVKLPAYSSSERPQSVQLILALSSASLKLGQEHGISGSLNVLCHRHFHVWINDNPKLPVVTKKSIWLMTLLLHLYGHAMNNDMEFYFMS